MNLRGDGESGTTLTEVLIVLAITTLLAAPLFAVVRTAARIQDDRQRADEARIELDRALLAMADDLRAGAPVATRPRGTRATDTVGVRVDDDSGAAQIVYWSLGPRGLRRFEADPATGRIRNRSTLSGDIRGGANGTAGETTFRYFDAEGRELDPLTSGLDRLADCTTLIEVTLSVAIDGDPDEGVVSGSARHAVRSRSPGVNRC